VEGFADHGVSEAIYLPDPDGNGIEIYRDRPRAEWPYEHGRLRMVSDPLDLNNLLAELAGAEGAWPGLHPDTVLGHMHLHVANLAQAEAFYSDVIGFDLIQALRSLGRVPVGRRLPPTHVGLNTWAGPGAPPPPPSRSGCAGTSSNCPARRPLMPWSSGPPGRPATEDRPEGLLLRDPSRTALILTQV